MPKMIPTTQTPGGKGTSVPNHYAVGSGSRPTGGKLKIPSSAPKNVKHRK